MMPVNLFVVRHGESIGNLAKRQEERGDNTLMLRLKGTHTAHWPLTEKGIEQAKVTGDYLRGLMNQDSLFFDSMYVSSYARAMMTAACLNIIRSQWSVDTRIAERDWGELDCMTDEERQSIFGKAIQMRSVEPFFWAPPNGEPFSRLIIRIRDFIDSLHRANCENAIVCCHGEVMKAFRIVLCQMTPEDYSEMEFSKDPLRRIHNCQIDRYTRRDPSNLALDTRLNWLQVYRPAEGLGIAIPWKDIPRRRFTSSTLLQMANKMSSPFKDITL